MSRFRAGIAGVTAFAVAAALLLAAPANAESVPTPPPVDPERVAATVVVPTPPPGDPDGIRVSESVADPGPLSGRDVANAPGYDWWNAGNIVSDALFYNGAAMSAAEVQAFLDSKGGFIGGRTWNVPALDVRGGDHGELQYCASIPATNGVSTAQAIAIVAQACSISPRVLLITMQKEQSLVTRSSADDWTLNHAFGYGCPDTAPCDDSVSGFIIQLYMAARAFQVYKIRADAYGNPKPGQTRWIQWSPDCGGNGSYVTIENWATAALYTYTPYQPISQVVNQQPIPADLTPCAAYGNYNFWALWWNWFGDPHGGDPSFIQAIYADLLGRAPDTRGLYFWNEQLAKTGDFGYVINSLLYSLENRQKAVRQTYQDVLRREGEQRGVDFWTSVTGLDQIPIDELRYSLMSSDEYYAKVGDGTDAGFIGKLYEDLLGRTPAESEIAYWAPRVPELGRNAVVWIISNVPESLGRRVEAMYQTILGRPAEPNGKAFWSQKLLETDDNALRLSLVASQEYRDRAAARFTDVAP